MDACEIANFLATELFMHQVYQSIKVINLLASGQQGFIMGIPIEFSHYYYSYIVSLLLLFTCGCE